MGLVMLGSGSEEVIDEMLQYAHETQHEKIIRGLAVGIAFICYGIQEQADGIIDKLLGEKVCTQSSSLNIMASYARIIGSYSSIRRNIHACPRLRRHFR